MRTNISKILLVSAVLLLTGPMTASAAAGDLFNDRGTVYYINQLGQKRPFSTPDVFFAHGFNFSQVRTATPDDLALPLGSVMTPPEVDGQVLGSTITYAPKSGDLFVAEGTVYYVNYLRQRRPFSNPDVFFAHGFNFAQVRKASLADLTLPEGAVMVFPDGVLLKVKNNPTVYVIEKGQKRPFATSQSFLSRGYSFQQVMTANPTVLGAYQTGKAYNNVAGANTEE